MRKFVGNLPLSQKLGLLGLIAGLMVAGPTLMYLNNQGEELTQTRTEVDGIAPAKALMRLVRVTQQHRGLSAEALQGSVAIESQRSAKQSEVDEIGKQFDATVQSRIDNPRIRSEWKAALGEWRSLSGTVAGHNLTGAESGARHTELIANEIELGDRVADYFRLTQDPKADTYFLIIGTLQQAPRIAEALGQARALGTLMLTNKEASPTQKAALAALADRARSGMMDLDITLEKSFEANAAVKTEVGPAIERAHRAVDGLVKLTHEQLLEAQTLNYASDDFWKTATAAIDSIYAANDSGGKALSDVLQFRLSEMQSTRRQLIAGLSIMLTLGVWIGIAIANSIIRPAEEARAVVIRVAAGDLSVPVIAKTEDEMGQLLDAIGQMQMALAGVVGHVRQGAEAVASASAQIAQGNQDLSERTEEQAGALQQTAASMEQLSATVQQNADNAREANRLAQSASTIAIDGGDAVARVVDTMKRINESSRRIADIIGVIDAIAFQTNILALNAAVEAARAGEQGRGFAVVASEVRSLAQRSAGAAKEIKTLISTSVERVEQGTALVDQAGTTMGQVVASIRRVSDIFGEISQATSEQSTGVLQVGEAITQMDQATQQNAALVEESAAAAESLQHQADQLVQAVAVFRLSQNV